MSFILDALRRAEAQRERGQVPGVHSQALAAVTPDGPARATRSPVVWWLGGLCVLLAMALAALWGLRGPAPGPTPIASVVGPASLATASIAGSAALPHPPPAMPAASVAALPAPASGAVAPPPASSAPQASRAAPAAVTPAPVLRAARTARAPAASAAATPASAALPPVTPAELPEPWRAAVARLNFSGAVHSSDPTQSFVMVGGQLMHEGDRVAAEITIEHIGPRAAVLRAGPHRVEIRY